MTIGYFAPSPTSPSGVADYAVVLRRHLAAFCDVRTDRSGDINLYQIGNNQLHREIYERALREPGAVLLHDGVLHHFLLGWLPREQYIEEFVHNYGEWHRGLAERLYERRARSGVDARYFRYAMLRRICETARLVIVHNPGSEALVGSHAPDARLVRIPHLLFASPSVHVRERYTFGIFGHLRETKRISTVLRVFAQVHSELPRTSLLLAGSPTSPALARLLAEKQPGVIRVPQVPEQNLWTLIHSVNVCLNLRYPAAGESSGITIRVMEASKPVVMTLSAENSDFPEGTCVRIDGGVPEGAMLAEVMRWLAICPADGRAMGAKAQAYVRRYHDPAVVARRVKEALSALVS